MKFRTGFVSNSSNSSFIVLKKYLSADQIDKIKNHIDCASENFPQIHYAYPNQVWNVEETEEQVTTSTTMDNFDMFEFLLAIGVEEDHIQGGRD
jgi:hypothetical protein